VLLLQSLQEVYMTYEEILRELASLPPEGQKEAADFIATLRERYSRSTEKVGGELASLSFVGMWRDREDMADSTAWVRSLREREWVK
jgi:hypothetical protein